MSETRPQKKLVSTERYVQIVGKKAGLYSFAGLLTILGLYLLLRTVFTLWFNTEWDETVFPAAGGLLIAGYTVFRLSKHLFVKGKQIEKVIPITERNAHLLTLIETLVRGSAHPITRQQIELLRAAQPYDETPTEQLVRPAGEPEP